MDMHTALHQALDSTGRVVAQVRTDQFSLPTPCTRYDVRALLNHMVGGQRLLAQAADGPVIQPDGGVFPDVEDGDYAGAYASGSTALRDLFARPGILGQTFQLGVDVPGEQALGIGLMEAVVHGWDLATATGQPTGADPAIAEMVLAAARDFVQDGFRDPEGRVFGPEVAIAPTAPAELRLVAFLGRQP